METDAFTLWEINVSLGYIKPRGFSFLFVENVGEFKLKSVLAFHVHPPVPLEIQELHISQRLVLKLFYHGNPDFVFRI